MGYVSFNIPKDIALELARLAGVRTFVETGTYKGVTARWAAEHFDAVYTVEGSQFMYEQYARELAKLRGVRPILGDSAVALRVMAKDLGPSLFWLDAHWSAGDADTDAPCPLMDELACLEGRSGDVVMIDDARLFLCAPPPPYRAADWPTITEVIGALPGRYVQVVDDVIFAVPNKSTVKDALTKYAQARSEENWERGVYPFGRVLRPARIAFRRARTILRSR